MLAPSAPAPALYARQAKLVTAGNKHPPRALSTQTGSPSREPDVEIICGMKVIRKTADDDPKIVVVPDPSVRGAIRTITPDVCTSKK